MTPQDKILRAKIALSLQANLNRQPKPEEIDRYYLAAKVLFEAVVGTRMAQRRLKKAGQLAIF